MSEVTTNDFESAESVAMTVRQDLNKVLKRLEGFAVLTQYKKEHDIFNQDCEDLKCMARIASKEVLALHTKIIQRRMNLQK
jgi:hypothetical protein